MSFLSVNTTCKCGIECIGIRFKKIPRLRNGFHYGFGAETLILYFCRSHQLVGTNTDLNTSTHKKKQEKNVFFYI